MSMSTSKQFPVDEAPSLPEPTLPPELEREIFLLTARTHRRECTNLMLVASRVKSWIEPAIYKTVVLCGTKQALRFLAALNCRSPEFAKTHVKVLSVCQSISLAAKLDLLTLCSGLESLTLSIQPQLEDTCESKLIHLLSSLSLTSLSISLPQLIPNRLNVPKFNSQFHPVAANLTHLYIVDQSWLAGLPSFETKRLSLLTHLAIRLLSRKTADGMFSTILSHSPQLRMFVFLADKPVLPWVKEHIEEQGVRDVRAVVLHHARDVDQRELRADEESIW